MFAGRVGHVHLLGGIRHEHDGGQDDRQQRQVKPVGRRRQQVAEIDAKVGTEGGTQAAPDGGFVVVLLHLG